MGEDERRAGDVADFAGAGGDVVKGAPPAGEQREPSFPEAAQGTLAGVAGAGIDVKFPAPRRLLDRGSPAGGPPSGRKIPRSRRARVKDQTWTASCGLGERPVQGD